MKEQIRLLIEEAGCDEGQAELALEAVQYDVEKAIRNIGTLLRDFVVIKGKFYQPRSNLFGLIIAIVNVRLRQMVRMCTVVSYNPVIYETDISMKWVAFEKQIFAHRLQDGTVRSFSQEIEQSFGNFFKNAEPFLFFNVFKKDNSEEIKRIFTEQVMTTLSEEKVTEPIISCDAGNDIDVSIECEEINLMQFRHLEEISDNKKPRMPNSDMGKGVLCLDVSLMLSEGGVRAADLIEGAVVQTIIIDERDIAQYLGKLMGGRTGNDFIPLPSSVLQVKIDQTHAEIHTWLASNIIGVARLSLETKVKVLYYADEGWWRRIFPW